MQIIKYFFDRVHKVNRMRKDYIRDDLNHFQSFMILVDLALSIVIYGCGITDYFQYQFYKRRHIDKKNFIVHRKRMWLARNFNDQEYRRIFDHKPSFNRKFNNSLGRDWLDINDCSFDEFVNFAHQVGKFLIKPVQGSHGIGIRVIEVDQHEDLKDIYNFLKSEKVLIEELILQHKQLADFNPSSVNTIRVVTFIDEDGNVNIMTANLRLGNGKNRYADNFHHNGIAVLLDVETGLAISHGVDKNLNYFIYHPLTNKQIIGFKVPEWNQIISTVKQVARVVPNVRYVGWDLAISKDSRIILVEGNSAADPDITQMPDQIGKWPLYKKLILGMKD